MNGQLECKGDCTGCGAPHGELCAIVRDLKDWKVTHEQRHESDANKVREIKIAAFVSPVANIISSLIAGYALFKLMGVH